MGGGWPARLTYEQLPSGLDMIWTEGSAKGSEGAFWERSHSRLAVRSEFSSTKAAFTSAGAASFWFAMRARLPQYWAALSFRNVGEEEAENGQKY